MIYLVIIAFIFFIIFIFRQQLNNSIREISNNLESQTTGNTFIQSSLSPKLLEGKDLDKIMPYIERLNDGVKNPDINNIALMGSYGSGKSTIIRNFKHQHSEHKALGLSLGSYSKKETDSEPNGDSPKDDLIEKLENSLVKQIIYRETNDKMPYSRFKKIQSISKAKKRKYTFFILLFILSILFLNDFLDLHSMLLNEFVYLRKHESMTNLIAYAIFIITGGLVLYELSKILIQQFKLSKLNIANVTIEGSDSHFSYFNKYIDEILYYFEINSFDVVIIEDVDRFNSIKVFEHLKELNMLLNNSKQLNKSITFIYAVKEDIFSKPKEEVIGRESENRTKFFDLIIPIIPVIDTFNSRDYLIPMMEKDYKTIERSLSDDFNLFLKEISLYIDDLRLLNNIVNEYFTYLAVHKNISTGMNEKALFSIIALKNLMPSAFADLQKSKGFLHDLIVKQIHDNSLIDKVKRDSIKTQNDIQKIDDAIKINRITEFKNILFDHGGSQHHTTTIQNKNIKLDSINEEFIDKALKENKLTLRHRNLPHVTILKKEYAHIASKSQKMFFQEKLQKQSKLKSLQSKIDDFYRLSLKDKFKAYPNLSQLIFTNNEDKTDTPIIYHEDERDFILYTLSNGYIAEDYSTYLSIFYEESSITVEDKLLLIKLKSNQPIEFDKNIDNINLFIEELQPHDFEKIGILNINILIYIFSACYIDNREIRNTLIEKLINQERHEYLQNLNIILERNKPDIVNLILGLLKEYKQQFYEKCNKDTMDEIINLTFYSTLGNFTSIYSKSVRENLLLELLNSHSTINDDSDSDNNLYHIKDNIINRPNFFTEIGKYVNYKYVMATISEHNSSTNDDEAKIYFDKNININQFTQKQFNTFIEYALFAYNPAMFSKILNYNTKEEVQDVSYQNILTFGNEDLITLVNQNYEDFVIYVLLQYKLLAETQESFLQLINHDIDSFTLKSKLIKRSNITITDINLVEDISLWNLFLKEAKCEITWENLFYYDGKDTDSFVFRTVFNNDNNLTSLHKQYHNSQSQEQIIIFLKKLVENNNIDVTQSNIALLSIAKYDVHNLDNVSMQTLSKHSLIKFSLDQISRFKEADVIVDILVHYPSEYMENHQEIDLIDDDLIQLIHKIDFEFVHNLLSIILETKPNEFYSHDEFLEVLIKRKVPSNDSLFLKLLENANIAHLKEYFIININEQTLDNKTIEQTLTRFLEKEIFDFPISEYNKIFETLNNIDLFVRLLNMIFVVKQLDSSHVDIVMKWLTTQNKPISQLLIKQLRTVWIDITEENTILLENLFKIGIVSSFSPKGNNTYKVNNKRKHPKIKSYLNEYCQ